MRKTEEMAAADRACQRRLQKAAYMPTSERWRLIAINHSAVVAFQSRHFSLDFL
jgi:hypothetical protein